MKPPWWEFKYIFARAKVTRLVLLVREAGGGTSFLGVGNRYELAFLCFIPPLHPILLFALISITKSQLQRKMFIFEHLVRMQGMISSSHRAAFFLVITLWIVKTTRHQQQNENFHWCFFHLSISLYLFTASLDDLRRRIFIFVVHSSSQLSNYDLIIIILLTRVMNELIKMGPSINKIIYFQPAEFQRPLHFLPSSIGSEGRLSLGSGLDKYGMAVWTVDGPCRGVFCLFVCACTIPFSAPLCRFALSIVTIHSSRPPTIHLLEKRFFYLFIVLFGSQTKTT